MSTSILQRIQGGLTVGAQHSGEDSAGVLAACWWLCVLTGQVGSPSGGSETAGRLVRGHTRVGQQVHWLKESVTEFGEDLRKLVLSHTLRLLHCCIAAFYQLSYVIKFFLITP